MTAGVGKLRQGEVSSPVSSPWQTRFKMLRRRRTTAIVTLVLFELVGISTILFLTRRYEASSIIQLEKSGYSGLDMDSLMGAAASGGEDSLSVNSDLQTQANIIESPGIVLKVAQNLNLENTYEFQAHHNIFTWALDLLSSSGPPEPPGLSLDQSPHRQRTVLRRFKKDLSTNVVPGTRLIEIKVATPDPVQAANINNALVQAVIQYNSQARYNATSETSKWLEGQLDTLRKQSEANRAKLVDVQKQTGLFGLGGTDSQGKAGIYSPVLDKLQQTEQALSQAEANRFLKEAVYHAVKSGNPEAISQLEGPGNGTGAGVMNSLNLLQSLREQEATIRAQIGKDANVYGARYPRLTSEREALEKVDETIREETNRILERAEKDYTIAVESESAARAEYESERAEATKLNNKTIDYVLLEKEADQSDSLYQSLQKRLQEAGMLEGARSTSISIVDDARPPAKAEKPNIPLLISGVILLGPAFAFLIASFRDSIDNNLEDVEALQRDGYRLIGVLPQFKSSANGFTPRLSDPRSLFQESMRRARLLRSNGASPQVERIPNVSPLDENDPNSPFSEAMRRIRSTILLANSSTPPQVILMASGSPGEGKTTVTLALGRSLTQLGKRVLVVEADLRHPTLGGKLDHDATLGLSSFIAQDELRLSDVTVHREGEPDIVLAGPVPLYPAEMLASIRFASFIEQARREYEFILIDSPPALPFADTQILQTYAVLTILIARSGVTPIEALYRCYRLLNGEDTEPGLKIKLGLIVNHLSTESSGYASYYETDALAIYHREGQER